MGIQGMSSARLGSCHCASARARRIGVLATIQPSTWELDVDSRPRVATGCRCAAAVADERLLRRASLLGACRKYNAGAERITADDTSTGAARVVYEDEEVAAAEP